MECYYVRWPWVTSKRVAQVCQHHLSFLSYIRTTGITAPVCTATQTAVGRRTQMNYIGAVVADMADALFKGTSRITV